MFKELIELWKGKETLFDEIVADFEEMLRIGSSMYDQVTGALFAGQAMADLKKTLYKEDAKLNMLEQTIRRKIVSQLSSAAGFEGPIASCLILMSISKDAERLGDYAKNMYSVFAVKPVLSQEEPYYGRLQTVRKRISELFQEVRTAYHESDKEKAQQLVEASYEAQQICDENLKDLLLAGAGDDHVAYAVLSRFFKRSLAHLSNIATSIFMPVTKIDFFDEIRSKDEE